MRNPKGALLKWNQLKHNYEDKISSYPHGSEPLLIWPRCSKAQADSEEYFGHPKLLVLRYFNTPGLL